MPTCCPQGRIRDDDQGQQRIVPVKSHTESHRKLLFSGSSCHVASLDPVPCTTEAVLFVTIPDVDVRDTVTY